MACAIIQEAMLGGAGLVTSPAYQGSTAEVRKKQGRARLMAVNVADLALDLRLGCRSSLSRMSTPATGCNPDEASGGGRRPLSANALTGAPVALSGCRRCSRLPRTSTIRPTAGGGTRFASSLAKQRRKRCSRLLCAAARWCHRHHSRDDRDVALHKNRAAGLHSDNERSGCRGGPRQHRSSRCHRHGSSSYRHGNYGPHLRSSRGLALGRAHGPEPLTVLVSDRAGH